MKSPHTNAYNLYTNAMVFKQLQQRESDVLNLGKTRKSYLD